MIKQVFSRAQQYLRPSLFSITPVYYFSSKLDRYMSIKKRNIDRIKKRKTHLVTLQAQEPATPQFHKEFISTTFGKLKCQGCSASLQSKYLERYGYIDEKVLSEYIKHNTNSLQHQIEKSDVNYQALREVQEELGITILDPSSKKLEEINDIDILLKIEEKIEALNQERQTLVQKEYKRKELYCRRCYYLKHHNQLPDEHNSAHNIITDTNTQQLLQKIFSKKQPNYYLYLVDSFDMSGTLTKQVIVKLCNSERQFSIILTKSDVINKKYLNYVGVKPAVRERLAQIIQQLKDQGKVNPRYNHDHYLEDIFMLSNQSQEGLTKIKKKIEGLNINVQLIGYPNTGKTSLLNLLTSMKKPTSTVPGTSLSFEVGKFNNIKIFDCPGFYNSSSLYNLILNPNERKKMTWKQPKFAPGILTNTIIFYGGMLEIEGVRVIVFGHGGAKAISPQNANEWLLNNYDTIWSGLPSLGYLGIKKYQFTLEFIKGETDDLQIAGYGFIGFKLCKVGKSIKQRETKKLTLYLPQNIGFNFRRTLILNKEVHNPSSVKNRFQLNSPTKPQNQSSEL